MKFSAVLFLCLVGVFLLSNSESKPMFSSKAFGAAVITKVAVLGGLAFGALAFGGFGGGLVGRKRRQVAAITDDGDDIEEALELLDLSIEYAADTEEAGCIPRTVCEIMAIPDNKKNSVEKQVQKVLEREDMQLAAENRGAGAAIIFEVGKLGKKKGLKECQARYSCSISEKERKIVFEESEKSAESNA